MLALEQHAAIKARYADGGVSQETLAVEFGVAQSTISRVLREKITDRGRELRELAELRAAGKKRCSACRLAKAIDEFPRNRAQPDGHASECSPCNADRSRARHAANPEPYRVQASAWSACPANLERRRKNNRKARATRRARVRGAFVEVVDPQVVWERDEGVCGICGKAADRGAFDVDHVVPLALGGEHSYANVRVAHVRCNRRRGRSVSGALAA